MITFDMTLRRPSLLIEAKGELAGGITVLTGPSGSGKSTIIKALAGLVPVVSGRITCNDTVWVDTERRIFLKPQQRFVGYMPQGNIIFPHLSVRQNITYSKRGDAELLQRILDRLNLERYKHRKAGSLSGGEQQRVALGRALYAKPFVLLLDEPLSALDWELRARVRRDIVTIVEEWKIPCLWVTHDKEEAAGIGQRHWRCKDGRLYEDMPV